MTLNYYGFFMIGNFLAWPGRNCPDGRIAAYPKINSQGPLPEKKKTFIKCVFNNMTKYFHIELFYIYLKLYSAADD